MYNVIGIGASKGEYKGFDYDNVILHCTYETKGVNGTAVKSVKVKSRIFATCPCEVGDVVNFYYDQYKNVTHIYKTN